MPLAKETRAEHCFDWITADDAVAMVVKAFAVARQHAYQDAHEPFTEDGSPWSCREDFANNLGLLFALQVQTRAYHLGIAEGRFEAHAVTLAKWGVQPDARSVAGGRLVARGRST